MALFSAVFSISAQLVSGLHDGFLASRQIRRFAVPGHLGVGDAKVGAEAEGHGAQTRSLLQNMLGACLEVPEGHAGEISMWQCEDMNPKQQWVYDEHTGQIRGTHGRCLHALERNTVGGQVRMQECNATSSHQQWAVNRSTGQIRNREGICLDGTNAGDVRMRQCDTSLLAKEWILLDPETMVADAGEAEHWPVDSFPVDKDGNHHLVLPKYQWFRFIPVGLRGDDNPPLVQIAEIVFAGADGSELKTCAAGVTAFGPGGWSPIGEGPNEAIDCKTNTKWVDLTVQALIVKFPEPVTATAFTFITANDSAKRDPVQWELEGARDGRNWVLLHSTEGVPADISMDRMAKNNWFPLHLHGPPTSTTTTTLTTTTMTTPTTSTTTSSTDSHTSTLTTTMTTYTSYTTLTRSSTTTRTTTSLTTSTSATSFTTQTISTMTATTATPTTRTFTSSTRTTITRTFTSLTHTTLTFTTLTYSTVTPTTVTTSTTHTTTTTPTSLTLTTTHTTFTTATPTTLTPTTITMTTATTSTTHTTTSTATETYTTTSTATHTHTSFTTATTSTTHTTSTTATDTSTLTTGSTFTTATFSTATTPTVTTMTRTVTTSTTLSFTTAITVTTSTTTGTSHTGSTWPSDSNIHVFKYWRFSAEATRDSPNKANMVAMSEIHLRGADGYDISWGSLQPRLIKEGRDCQIFGTSLGLHNSADECAIQSRIYKDCSYISYAPLDPTLDCRCCTSPRLGGGSSRSLYEVWYSKPDDPRQVVATNPMGDQPVDGKGRVLEGALKVVDGDVNTKWLDFSTEALILEFNTPVAANAFTYSTSNDFPERDPIQWFFEGSNDGQNWLLLHRTEGPGAEDIKFDRLMKNDWFPFAFNAGLMPCCYAYSVFRFIPIKTRAPAADCYQISEFYLMGADYETPHANMNFLAASSGTRAVGVTVENPNGDNPDDQRPEKIIDNSFSTKFLDFNIEPVVFNFERAVRVLAFAYVTGDDVPERDPVQWLVQGSHDGLEWVDLHSTNGNDANIPTARRTQTSVYLFHMPPVASTARKLAALPEQS